MNETVIMLCKYLIYVFLILTVSLIHNTNGANPEPEPRFIIHTIIKAINFQIKLLTSLVERIVNNAIADLVAIQQTIADITLGSIKLAIKAINSVIDGAIDSVRKIAEDALDAGLNITQCYVRSIDDLNVIRRQLLVDEVVCATSQLQQFNAIIGEAMESFTNDLVIVLELPSRMTGCMVGFNKIKCTTELISDIARLQQEIPKQILKTMADITAYMIMFDKRVHDCQFDQLRKAIDKTREVIDGMRYCVNLRKSKASMQHKLNWLSKTHRDRKNT